MGADVEVAIIGGGASGLALSIFLSNYNVKHVLFQKHATTSLLPKAHYLNQRTMEIFLQQGIADAVVAESCPTDKMCRVDFRTSLGGDGPFDGKLIGSLPAFGGSGRRYNAYREDSPIMPTNLPLLRLEPILLDIARQKNPLGVLFSHYVEDFVDQGDEVVLTVRKPDSSVFEQRCRFLVAADAGKLSHKILGIDMQGLTNLACMASTHFKADLSKYHNGQALITHLLSPRAATSSVFSGGALVPMGPTWGSKSEEWSLHFGFPADVPAPRDPAFLANRIRELLNIPDLELEILQCSSWIFDRVVASKFQSGNCFIIGDAAHRIPPAGGLGLNTAIEDALNIAFKFALIKRKVATTKLLDSYEAERKPVAIRNADWGLHCLSHFPTLQHAVGFQPGNEAWNGMRMAHLFGDSHASKCALHAVRRIIATQDIEFQARDLELGFRYDMPGAAIVPSRDVDFKAVEDDPTGKTYVQSCRPGGRLPHVAIGFEGKIHSTQDLFRILPVRGDFLLITDRDGAAQWREAVSKVNRACGLEIVPVVAVIADCSAADIKHLKPGLVWIEESWRSLREHGDGGAILVRGDNFVAWATEKAANKKAATLLLTQVMCKLLCVEMVEEQQRHPWEFLEKMVENVRLKVC